MALRVAEETKQGIYEGVQYVNYSNITLRPPTSQLKEENGPAAVKRGVQVEEKINTEILKIPICQVCSACTSDDGRLCERRLDVRRKLIAAEKAHPLMKDKTKPQKRKAEHGTKKPDKPAIKSSISTVKKNKMMRQADGQLKVRVTSQGNKRMSIPDELFPEFCRKISAAGTSSRTSLVNEFIEAHPTISARQVTLRLAEVTTRDRPACVPEAPPEKKKGPKFMFYLRPCFYKYLPEDERPDGWEQYAEVDQKAYDAEQAAEEKANSSTPKSTPNGSASPASSKVSETTSIVADGDETEEDDDDDSSSEPQAKKIRTQ
jgi:hypothetical protein